VRINNGKIYLDKNISIKHEGASSVEKTKKIELEKNRNWHWMWSTFYFQKKYNGFLIALLLILPKFISSSFKILFYLLIFNSVKRDIYFCRLSGILNSILGKNSWYRPSLD
jgi:N-acetylglucosaminyl-diphospho-decaprenol L-rhamnosyltransferase